MPTLRGVTHAAPGEAIKYNTQNTTSHETAAGPTSRVCVPQNLNTNLLHT